MAPSFAISMQPDVVTAPSGNERYPLAQCLVFCSAQAGRHHSRRTSTPSPNSSPPSQRESSSCPLWRAKGIERRLSTVCADKTIIAIYLLSTIISLCLIPYSRKISGVYPCSQAKDCGQLEGKAKQRRPNVCVACCIIVSRVAYHQRRRDT